MVKAYLRYEFASAFGVITSGCAPVYDASGKLLVTASLESLSVWNVKQGRMVQNLAPQAASTSTSTAAVAQVTALARPPSGSQVAAGYSDGSVRLWDLESGDCMVTLKGHKSAVTALRFHASGAQLASGSKDTDIILWDVVGETGLYRLRGHKDQVTDLAFLSSQSKLISSSKDGYVKVWDLDTQHCCQTVTGHKAEVWALDVDPAEKRVVVGSSDQELRMYAVMQPGEAAAAAAAVAAADAAAASVAAAAAAGSKKRKGGSSGSIMASTLKGSGATAPPVGSTTGMLSPGLAPLVAPVLRAMGSVKRVGQDRVGAIKFDATGGLLACQGTGKTLELFRVRDPETAFKKLKRRKKRRREKAHKKSKEGHEDDDGEGDDERGDDELQASDELEAFQVVTCKGKIKGFAFAVLAGKPKPNVVAAIALALSNNSIEMVEVGGETAEVSARVDIGGHRSDVRALALSGDDQSLLSTSNTAVKLWNPVTGACLATMESGYGLCALFAPGNRHAVVGTKEGTLEVFDLGASARTHVEAAHDGPVWSLAPLPDRTGFVSGSADKTVKFWQWSVVSVGGAKQLRVTHMRTLKMADDVLCVRTSADGRLLAVALLDATVKVFYLDSLKFFLSLYGHKLPVLSMDISSDGTLLVTGSADKNIKIWGLDFGDCHRSLFAHNDAVMSVAFVPNTHYVLTTSKDRAVKYWDVDRAELLLELAGHHAEVWAVAVSAYGDFFVTGSHDRSIRRWERTAEPFFVEEEKEKRLESLFEADVENERPAEALPGSGEGEGSAAAAGRKTLESLGAADAIIDALDMAAHESQRQADYQASLAVANAAPTTLASKVGAAASKAQAVAATAKPLPPNPLMMGLEPAAYVLRAVGGVRPNDLEQALLMLPFSDAVRLLSYLPSWFDDGGKAELCVRVAVLLLRLHHAQLVASSSVRPMLLQLQGRMRASVQGLKDTMGFNLAALRHLQRLSRQRAGVGAGDNLLPARKALART